MDVSHAIRVVSVSDVGLVRELNEDAVAVDLSHGLVMLADGIGGHNGGEVASEAAMLIIRAEFADLFSQAILSIPDMLTKAVVLANQTIVNIGQDYATCAGMGTTFVGGVFADNTLVVGHIGDSRMYRVRDAVLLQLTEDHSVLQEKINAGLIAKQDAKHASDAHLVTRALGASDHVELTLGEYATKVGDLYLLCSDGLTDLVGDEEIKGIIVGASNDMEQAANQLIALAKQYGGHDNISVVIAMVQKSFATERAVDVG